MLIPTSIIEKILKLTGVLIDEWQFEKLNFNFHTKIPLHLSKIWLNFVESFMECKNNILKASIIFWGYSIIIQEE